MSMKLISSRLLRRLGYRQVLIVNTLLIGITIGLFSLIDIQTPIVIIVVISLPQGFFNSLQFAGMNSLGYADVTEQDSSMASTISSSLQQLSMGFGLAAGSLITGWFLGDVPQTDRALVSTALQHAFLALSLLTLLSSLTFWKLHRNDGESISRGKVVKVG